ncbi:tetratricopeptide repeat-containing protein [Streptomyces venezuelae]|uniref:Tetratricopeptide repeat-containing protein n=1 Tax=Streptomyces venezuelae TaxID=54571 RepID=A0A5P2D152_STRVZ|nr:tetratricopeptide repeat protein [Streptomyces venezuelae]QES48872.1 tetratricopeptide repeat-containing protein [Streptomyces venezuelae]
MTGDTTGVTGSRNHHNEISGGVFHNVVVQGGTVTLQLPPTLTPALTGMPSPAATFTGRESEVNLLLDGLRPPPQGSVRQVVSGLAGIGKTELVLQVAHRALQEDGRFPGGALFIDLFGYDTERRVTPDRALGQLLRALGIPDEHVPAGLQERTRLYRSVLASYADQGRRVLLVLDNARTAEQVAPLLSGDPRIPALVTSRHTLALPDAHLHDLSVLDEAAAVELLDGALRKARGPAEGRVASAPDEAAALARLCGFLPLALRIVAALLADLPQRPLSSMTEALEDSRQRLGRLSREDLAVRAAFGLSYEHLGAGQARLFRLLPINPGADIATEAAARLADTEPYPAEEVLQDLARGHLIEPGATYGRWRMHDLIRLYAEELGREQDPEAERRAARGRLHVHYLSTAREAGYRLHSDGPAREAALAWLEDERANLVATTVAAVGLGYVWVPGHLLTSLTGFLSRQRYFVDWVIIAAAALDCARASGSRADEALALFGLSGPLRSLRRFDEACSALERAIAYYRSSADPHLEGSALVDLGLVFQEMRRFDDAVTALTRALSLLREVGDRHGVGKALTNLGLVHMDLHHSDEAIDLFTQDIAICVELGDRLGEAQTLGSLGTVLRRENRLDEAADALTRGLAAHREVGDTHGEAQTLNNLGLVWRRMDRLEESVEAHTRAIEIFRLTHAPRSKGLALNNLGLALLTAERFEEAVGPLELAIRTFREIADRHQEGGALTNLASVLAKLDRPEEAVDAATRSVDCLRATGDRHGEAVALYGLARHLEQAGRSEEALAALAAAVPLLRETNNQDYAAAAEAAQNALRAKPRT